MCREAGHMGAHRRDLKFLVLSTLVGALVLIIVFDVVKAL